MGITINYIIIQAILWTLLCQLVIYCFGIEINVTIQNSIATSCFQLEDPVCSDLMGALKEWSNKTLPRNISQVNFNIFDYHQNINDETKLHDYIIPANVRYNIIGRLDERINVQFFNNNTLTFHGSNSSLSVNFITFIVNDEKVLINFIFSELSFIDIVNIRFTDLVEVHFTNVDYVKFTNVAFTCLSRVQLINVSNSIFRNVNYSHSSKSGIQLINVDNIHFNGCNLEGNTITPNAALLIAYRGYGTSVGTVRRYVIIENCHFTHNKENIDYAAQEGSSGVIAFAISSIALQNLSFTLSSCTFTNNDMALYMSDAPLIYVFNVADSNISISIEHCMFTSNIFSVMTKMTSINNNTISIMFNNCSFSENSDPYGQGILNVYIINPLLVGIESVSFHYSQMNFSNNYGMAFHVFSRGYSRHNIQDCVFIGNHVLPFSSSHVVYLTSTKNDSYFYGYTTNMTMNNIVTRDNLIQLSLNSAGIDSPSVILVKYVNLLAENLNLTGPGGTKSVATLLTLVSVNGTFKGLNSFNNNRGVYGGGLSIMEVNTNVNFIISATVDTVLSFNNNYADYGGAVYIDSPSFVQSLGKNTGLCLGLMEFHDNHARVAGHAVYYNSTLYNVEKAKKCRQLFNVSANSDNQGNIATAPVNLIITPASITVFPGQIIKLSNVTLTDALDNRASCASMFELLCDDSDNLCEQSYTGIELIGPTSVFLTGKNSIVDTQLYIARLPNFINTGRNITLKFKCMNPRFEPEDSSKVISSISVSLQSCPVGFTYNSQLCKCQCLTNVGFNFQCSQDNGIACIKKGYWIGQDKDKKSVILKCPFPLCKLSDSTHCPSIFGEDMFKLPLHIDGQCALNRGGLRCSQCHSNHFFTFVGLECTSNCEKWHPFALTLFAICFQVLTFTLILAVLSLKLEIGSGFLYGPLLFLAIANQMHYGYYPHLKILKVVVSMFSSIFLLDLQIFGHVQWCFWHFDSLAAASFYYLGPILVWIMLLLLVYAGRCCPKLLSKIQDSPVQAISLLIMLSFWSIVHTSINLLRPLKVNNKTCVELNPNIGYFQSWHILFAIVAITFIVITIVPFIAILVFSNSPKASRCFHIYRMKPLLDEFQSCYHDNYRWYCVMYFVVWIIYLICRPYELIGELILVLILSLHFVFQPYKRKFLNIADMLLLLDLLILTSLLKYDNEGMILKDVLIYVLTILPLSYIFLCTLGIFMTQLCCRNNCTCLKHIRNKMCLFKRSSNTIQVTHSEIQYNEQTDEREPLIRVCQEKEHENIS